MPTGAELPALSLVKRIGRNRAASRKATALTVFELLDFEPGASDEDLWRRLGREICGWGAEPPAVIAPLRVSRMKRCLAELDPTATEPRYPALARQELRSDLTKLYDSLTTNDGLGRWWRNVVYLQRTPYRLKSVRRARGASKRTRATAPVRQ
jgi:hypothetical protein